MASNKAMFQKLLNKTKTYSNLYSHIGMDDISGKYCIERDDIDSFWSLYMDEIRGNKSICLAEKYTTIPPVLVDVDIKLKIKNGTDTKSLRHTDEHILDTIEIYQKVLSTVIRGCVDVHLICVVLEKPPYVSDGYMKHGFHLHFPYCFMSGNEQKTHILPRVQKLMKERNVFKDIGIEDSSTVIDDVTKKPWLMYGSSKKSGMDPYLVTKIYDHNFQSLSFVEAFKGYKIYDSDEELIDFKKTEENIRYYLPQILSIKMNNRPMCEVKPNLSSIGMRLKRKTKKAKQRMNRQKRKVEMKEIEVLLSMLDVKRSDEHNNWMEIGWCLFNLTDGSEDGLELWCNFSSNSDKYEEQHCIQRWERMVNTNSYTIKTLEYYAKIDNLGRYREYKTEQAKKIIEESLLSESSAHNDVAKAMYRLHGDEYVCASIENKMWYQYTGNKWEHIQDGVYLRNKISEGPLIELYRQKKRELHRELSNTEDKAQTLYLKEKLKPVNKMIYRLKERPFKKHVMAECMDVFFDPGFLQKLDVNPNIFPFKNGIYDLNRNIFRETKPNDYVSQTSPIEYDPSFRHDSKQVKAVHRYLEQVFPNQYLREYFKTVSSDVFQGGNFMKQAYFWTGEEGDNAKSVTQMFFDLLLGPLAVKLPTNIITGKKVATGSAMPELARAGGGVRLVTMEEPDAEEQINIGTFKNLTGNDKFYARDLFQKGKDVREIQPLFKFCFICNKLPFIKHSDKATFNRIRVIKFESTFVRPTDPQGVPDTYEEQLRQKRFPMDPNFSRKIPSMVPAFAWVLLEHRKTILVNRPIEPDIVLEATNNWKKRNDFFTTFFDDYLQQDKKSIISLSELYKSYKEFCEEEGVSQRDIPKRMDVEKQFSKKNFLGAYNTRQGKQWKGWKIVNPNTIINYNPTDILEQDEKSIVDMV